VIRAYYKIDAADDWIELISTKGPSEVTFTGTTLNVGAAATAGDENGNGFVRLKTSGYEIIDGGADANRKKMLRA